jgi:hypothetical protein
VGQIERFVGGRVCDGSLAELRGFYSAGATSTNEGGDIYGRRIQQSYPTLSGKIQKKNKVLQQVQKNDRNIIKLANKKLNKKTIPD